MCINGSRNQHYDFGRFVEQTARNILGEYYQDVARYFLCPYLCVSNERPSDKLHARVPPPTKVIFITRRSNVLSALFGEIFRYYAEIPMEKRPEFFQEANLSLAEIDEIEANCFITDSALLAQGKEIADYYVQYQKLPKLYIFDELLLHGRALNNFLIQLEVGISQQVMNRVSGFEVWDKTQFSERLVHAIELQVYVQSDEALLLLARYQQRLNSRNVFPVLKVRELSKRFSMLIALADQNNVGFSWSFRMPYTSINAQKLQSCPEGPGIFYRRATTVQYTEVINYLLPFPNAECPKAIGSVRWRQSSLSMLENENALLLVPFTLYGNVPFKNLLQLHQKIVEDLQALGLHILTAQDTYLNYEDTYHTRWVSEVNDLVLNALMCSRFFQQYGISDIDSSDIDYDFMARNYASFTEDGNSVKQQLKSLWDWSYQHCNDGMLETYMEILLKGVPPIWESTGEKVSTVLMELSDRDALLTAVEDTIIEIADATELDAYEKFQNGLLARDDVLSNQNTYYSIYYIFRKLIQKLNGRVSLSQRFSVLAFLLHAMDLGIIGMNPAYQKDSGTVFTATRAGEQARFLKPERYQIYIPVLLEIQKRCEQCHLDLRKEIHRLFEHAESGSSSLPDLLYVFIKELEAVGDCLQNWDMIFTLPRTVKHFRLDISQKFDDEFKKVLYEQLQYLEEYSKI